MKVLFINRSPRGKDNTYIALPEVASALEGCGMETTRLSASCIFSLTALYNLSWKAYRPSSIHLPQAIQPCTVLAPMEILSVNSPTYYAGSNGSPCTLLNRVFYSSSSGTELPLSLF